MSSALPLPWPVATSVLPLPRPQLPPPPIFMLLLSLHPGTAHLESFSSQFLTALQGSLPPRFCMAVAHRTCTRISPTQRSRCSRHALFFLCAHCTLSLLLPSQPPPHSRLLSPLLLLPTHGLPLSCPFSAPPTLNSCFGLSSHPLPACLDLPRCPTWPSAAPKGPWKPHRSVPHLSCSLAVVLLSHSPTQAHCLGSKGQGSRQDRSPVHASTEGGRGSVLLSLSLLHTGARVEGSVHGSEEALPPPTLSAHSLPVHSEHSEASPSSPKTGCEHQCGQTKAHDIQHNPGSPANVIKGAAELKW